LVDRPTGELTHYPFPCVLDEQLPVGRHRVQRLLDFLIAGKLAPIDQGYTLLDFLNLPLFQRIEFASFFS
jgi:hypothetical protein